MKTCLRQWRSITAGRCPRVWASLPGPVPTKKWLSPIPISILQPHGMCGDVAAAEESEASPGWASSPSQPCCKKSIYSPCWWQGEGGPSLAWGGCGAGGFLLHEVSGLQKCLYGWVRFSAFCSALSQLSNTGTSLHLPRSAGTLKPAERLTMSVYRSTVRAMHVCIYNLEHPSEVQGDAISSAALSGAH